MTVANCQDGSSGEVMRHEAQTDEVPEQPSHEIEIHLGEHLATLQVNGKLTLDAAQMEDLVASLAEVRSRMQPEVQPEPPSARSAGFVSNPSYTVQADVTGGTLFTFIRHPMYGWITLSQSQDEAMQMVLAMARQLNQLDGDQTARWRQ
jgi:hypothetical protein